MKKSVLSALVLSLSLIACGTLPCAPAQAQGIYAKAGLLGAGLGYSHRISNRFAVRADFTTVGAFKRSGTIDWLKYRQLNYRARLKANQLGIYGDWFPFDNGLRLSAGLHVRQLQANLQVRPSRDGIRVGKIPVRDCPKCNITGRIKFPALAPYLGLGWESGLGKSGGGGNILAPKSGWSVMLDAGVSFGQPKADITLSRNLRILLELESILPGGNKAAMREVEAERRKLLKRANKVRFFPHLYVGLAYRF